MAFDLYFFQVFHGLAEKNWVLDALSVFFAKYVIYLLVLASFYFFWRLKNWRRRFYFFALSFSSLLISRGIIFETINRLFARSRPGDYLDFTPVIHGSGFSFPSGHAVFLFTLAFSIFVFDKKWGSLFALLSFLVGLSRIIVGAHWPTDVIFGIMLGTLIPFIIRPFLFPKKESPRLN